MDLIFEKEEFAQLVKPVEPVEVKLPENSAMNVDINPNSDFVNNNRVKVEQEDPNLFNSCFAGNTSADDKLNISVDNVVCRWVDSNNVHYHQIYPIGITMYDVEDVFNGINLNSLMGSYKGMIESIVSSGTTYSVTLNYHSCNNSRQLHWLSYGQEWTKP